MNHVSEQIDEAWRQVDICRRRSEKPEATIEDELALERARNHLLTLELRALKHSRKAQCSVTSEREGVRTGQPTRLTAKERAERDFAELQKGEI